MEMENSYRPFMDIDIPVLGRPNDILDHRVHSKPNHTTCIWMPGQSIT
jgi:hypothetical protein